MRTVSLLRLAIALAAAMLLTASASASANRLSLDDTDVNIAWREVLITSTPEAFALNCNLTLNGSLLANPFDKSAGSTVVETTPRGYPLSFPDCSEGGLTISTGSLPWDLTYDSFSGSLPEISSVRLDLIRFGGTITYESIRCGIGADVAEPAPVDFAIEGEVITEATFDAEASIDATDTGGVLCDLLELSVSMSGTATVEDGARGTVGITLAPADPAVLTSTPSSVSVTRSELNDSFVVRNTDADATATITRVDVETSDEEAPEFEVTAPGCPSRIGPGQSCTYVVVVNTRPQREGTVTIHYRDGATEAERTLAVRVDIEI